MTAASATVVITTKNRKADLATAIESALAQTARPEVLIIDDGSTDGTSQMVQERFPTVRLDRVQNSLGLIVQRNRAASLATGQIIFSIDDDAAFSTPNIVVQTLQEFDRPRIGAVAIPFVDVKKGPRVLQKAPQTPGVFATFSYIGTAHALRRDLFLALGGYHQFLFHQGEEMDLAMRMLDNGYIVRLGSADPIHHFESPQRDLRRMDLYGRRNEVLYAWYNIPMPYLPGHLMARTLNGIRFGLRVGRPIRMIHGLAMGYAALVHEFSRRHAVSCQTYQLSCLLMKREAVPLQELEPQLPPLPQ